MRKESSTETKRRSQRVRTLLGEAVELSGQIGMSQHVAIAEAMLK